MALVNLRNALMTGKRLPYDAEVEYLESTGTQWIDTGVPPSYLSTEWELDWAFTATTNGRFMGANYGPIADRYNLGIESNHFRFAYGNAWFTAIETTDTARHKWKILNTNNTYVASIDNTTVSGSVSVLSTALESRNIYLCARSGRDAPSENCSGKIYRCKITRNSVLVRDYIPVRKGTVGYLYDRVSGKLFGNAGTGAFGYGNDLPYPIPA